MRFSLFLIFVFSPLLSVAQAVCERLVLISQTNDHIYQRAKELCYNGQKWGAIEGWNYCVMPKYDTLIPLQQSTSFIAAINGKYGVVSEEGVERIAFIYDTIVQDAHDFAALKNGKWGLLAHNGKASTEFVYDRIVENDYRHYHLFFNKKEIFDSRIGKKIHKQFKLNDTLEVWGPEKEAWTVLTRNKNGILMPSDQNGIAPVGYLYKVYMGDEIYYCNRSGKKIQLPVWMAEIFTGSDKHIYMILTTSHHVGFVDEHFKIVSDTIWDQAANPFWMGDEGMSVFWLKKTAAWPNNDSCHGGWMMCDENGKLISEIKFHSPIYFSECFSSMCRKTFFQSENGKIGMIDDAFQIIVPPVYDSVWSMYSYNHPMLLVKANDKFGIIDTSGKLIVDTVYDYVASVVGMQNDYYFKKGNKKTFFIPDSLKFMSEEEYYRSAAESNASRYFYMLVDYRWNVYYDERSYNNLAGSLYWYLKLINVGSDLPLHHFLTQENSGDDFNYYTENSYRCWRHEYIAIEEYPKYQLYALDSSYISFFRADTAFPVNYSYNDKNNFYFQINPANQKYHFDNYAISGDTIHTITLESLFIKSDTLFDALHRRACKSLKSRAGLRDDYKKNGYHLTNNFLLTGTSGVILFEESLPDENGNTHNFSVLLTWKELKDLIDPKGPLGKKI